ncbi:lytic polysaccharide monooxygenase auxiliary activity family 9 protein [Streptomyces sp. NRRL B-24484]|uniref:lytic polysaccharide monooxygenase auxiliary activity family 9 protein n=1 Tax=Streptomyces sp. NRRL B-24484 TaxID=1463833 RepID=UPI0004C18381|nr:lytic polysaccharide monooxygenase [Streptomyces sp. NRRL B-24484]
MSARPSARRRVTVLAGALAGLALSGTLGTGTAAAHGSMQNPLSRVEGCYLEGPEHPKSAACAAVVARGGTQALYDWNGVRIGDANGRHQQLIPDGKLCSANNAEFTGLDLPRADWPATNLTAGAPFTFRYRATAPHRGTFRLYVTNGTYDPAKPLAWSNLQSTPFLTVTDPQLVDGQYVLPGKVPAGLKGRQLIYAIWQRSDSPEAFYSCSDVVFDGSGRTAGTAPVPPSGSGTPHVHDSAPAPVTTGPGKGTGTGTGAGTPAAVPAAATGAPTGAGQGTPGTSGTPAASGTPAGTDAVPAGQQLAQTGTDRSTGLIAAVGTAFVLSGAAMAVLRRRNRARGTHTR